MDPVNPDDDRCPRCGVDQDFVEVYAFGRPVRRIPVTACCVPPPTADQMRRRAEDDWLRRQRELAEVAVTDMEP